MLLVVDRRRKWLPPVSKSVRDVVSVRAAS